jgi:transposase
VDEIHWGHGLRADNFLTVIYQIDGHCRRLLWVGKRRSQATLRRGLKALGPEVIKGLRFVCSDMWKPYLQVIAAQAGHALHVLDRFHITSHLNQAVDQVRRTESTRLRAKNKQAAQRLKHMRWPLLRRGSRVRGKARQKLNALLASKLATARAWELKETFSHFWKYKSVLWAGAFLDYWCFRALRSRLEPMQIGCSRRRSRIPCLNNSAERASRVKGPKRNWCAKRGARSATVDDPTELTTAAKRLLGVWF